MQSDLVMADSARFTESKPPSPAVAGRKLFDRRFSLIRQLAQSNGATVYAAEHAFTRRPVAIKIPREAAPSTALARVRREIEALALARGEGVVEMLDAGEVDRKPFIVFELLEGRTLAGLIAARGKLLPEEVVRVGIESARALERCHQRGVIHRDIKPSNLFVTIGSGAVKLLDFGIAKLGRNEHGNAAKLTQESAVLGTPEYMAPESLMADPNVDHRADVYGLGVTLYECLTGLVPFEGQYGEVLIKVSTAPAPSIQNVKPDAPAALCRVIERCLARAPSERFQSMSELAFALDSLGGASNLDVNLLERPAAQAPNPRSESDTLADAPLAKQREHIEARRKHPRAPYATLARITSSDGFCADGRIEEVSEGGLQFVGNRGIEAGTAVKIRFALPASGKITEVGATARWTRSVRGNNASGFQFDDILESAREEIRRYVEIVGRD